jgi:hypothetical protein
MKLILILALPVLIIIECGNHKSKTSSRTGEPGGSIPACIKQQIEAIRKEPKRNPPAQVDEYIYNGKKVFLFSANCCDQYNMLYDSSCKIICAPSGGITGKGDGKCTDFSATAKYVKLVWSETPSEKDSR